jgi:HEPN domain-containing protein
MKNQESEASRWLEQAGEDLVSAKVVMEAGRYYLVCFLSQQIAEKALKAFLYASGEPLVTGHSVERLAAWAAEYEPEFENLREEISPLDGYYIPTRYPNGLAESIPARVYNRASAEGALHLATQALEQVQTRLAGQQ